MAEEKAEEKKKKLGGKNRGKQKVGRFETDENGHYKWAGPRTEKGGSIIYDVLSAVFVGRPPVHDQLGSLLASSTE